MFVQMNGETRIGKRKKNHKKEMIVENNQRKEAVVSHDHSYSDGHSTVLAF